jgi:hypothetical protein
MTRLSGKLPCNLGKDTSMRRRSRELDPAAVEYEAARVRRELAAAITWYMSSEGPTEVARTQLAQRLGVTPGRVSQILSGDENLTLNTVAVVCVALGAQLETKLVDNDGRRNLADQGVDPPDVGGGRKDRHPHGILSGKW